MKQINTHKFNYKTDLCRLFKNNIFWFKLRLATNGIQI